MNWLYFAAATVVVVIGHFFRTKRWKSLISVYEDTSDSGLLSSMSFGYLTDIFLPFHAGDVVRAVYTGRHLTNKTAFSLATIIVDRLLDVLIVSLLYLGFYLFKGSSCFPQIIVYSVITVILFIMLAWSMTFGKSLKKAVLALSSVFNEKIQLWILGFGWSCICTFENILHKINKPLLILRTVCMWICYMLSYKLLGAAVEGGSTFSVFNTIFALRSFSPLIEYINSVFSGQSVSPVILIYNIFTCLLLLAAAALTKAMPKKTSKHISELIIPYNNENGRLDFLKIYFSDIRDRSWINAFLAINKDVTILRNCSAGSNATTLLCIRNDEMLFRKYAFGDDGDKLYAQTQWLQNNSNSLYVTEIRNIEKQEKICCYDMPYLSGSVGFFDFIHSVPAEQSWKVLLCVIEDLERNYSAHSAGTADTQTIAEYVKSKVLGNLKKICAAPQIRHLLSYDTLIINGKPYRNLSVFMERFSSAEFWISIFRNDYFSDIHGDLTIENIIYNADYPKHYYLIDPNGGNIHNSPNLDYAKLLQSLHGSYEFLMHTSKVNVVGNEISFRMIRSAAYDTLYWQLREYLFSNYSRERVRSIYFHEIIHWFRLMPYKINNDSERAVLFYSGMIMVIHDILEEFTEYD